MDIVSYLLARSYVKKTLAGVGAIKGKPCQIQNIEPITGGKRVTFLWVDNSDVEHTSTMDIMNGLRGEQGLQGIQGPQGPAGVAGPQGAQGAQGIAGAKGDKGDKGDTGNTGAKGDDGVSATIRIGSVTSGESVSVNNVGTNTDAVFDFTLPKGDKGDKGDKGEDGADGKSFEIKARFQTEQELIAAYPTGPDNPSDAYFVGTTTSPDLYTWLSDDHEWFNNGPIAGVKGDKGDTGDDGFSPVASVSKSGKVVTISIRDKVGQTTTTVNDGEDGAEGKSAYEVAVDEGFVGTEAEWLASLVGPQGIQGPQGLQGIQGEQGIQGPVGPAGAGLPEGGTTGQTLTKRSATDYDYEWTSLGTAATKDANGVVRPTENRLVDGNAVASAINQALTSVYQPRESIYCADLTSELLIEENVNGVYEILDSGTTSALFVQGAGITINQYDNVGVIKAGPSTIMFNYMGHALDLHDYQKKDLASAIEGATTVEGALGALSTNKATQLEVNDIVNVLGAKNLLPNNATSQTINGITFTVNADGSITANGTASATLALEINREMPLDNAKSYILNGCADGGEWEGYRLDVYEHSNGLGFIGVQTTEELVISNKSSAVVRIRVASGTVISNKTFKPMLRLASDPDNTYEPYAMTNQQLTAKTDGLWDNTMNNGAVNLLENVGTTTTTNGITFAVNSDGTVTVSGTATANASLTLKMRPYLGNSFPLKLSGCPAGGSFSSGYRLQYANYFDMTDLVSDEGDGAIITKQIDYTTYPNARISIEVRSGTQISSPIVFKPMVSDASLNLSYDDYVPYAKTNRELTDIIPSDASASNKLVVESELKNTYTLTRVDEHTCTFDLSVLPYTLNGLCLINLVGGYNLQSSVVCSIGYYNEWRVDGVTALVNASNVGTITTSVSGSTLTISNTGTNYNGTLSIRVGQLFNV